jgi:hypothetical protein
MLLSVNLIEVASHLALKAEELRLSDRPAEAAAQMAQAYSAALTGYSGIAAAAEFQPFSALREVTHLEHFAVRITPQALRLRAPEGVLHRSVHHIRRFNVIGYLCGVAARSLPPEGMVECVFDVGDGTDRGDYRRFAFSSSLPNATLIPDPYFFETMGYQALRQQVAALALPWEERQDVVFWRGAASGHLCRPWPPPGEEIDLGVLPRLALCQAATRLDRPDRADVGVTCVDPIGPAHIRQAIRSAGLMRPVVDKSQFMRYRYQIDIDGYSNAWSLIEKMIMGSTILKVASRDGFRQWFYDRLEPWIHFVPVAADLSDFAERVAWLFDNPGAAREIADNGAALAASLDFRTGLLEAEARLSLSLACCGMVLG